MTRARDRIATMCTAGLLVAAVACPTAAQTFPEVVTASVVASVPDELAARVAPSVVPVLATAYGLTRGSGLVNLQRLVGAGTIVDASGYNLTSAHLVADAMQVDVVIGSDASTGRAGQSRVLPAEVVGMVPDLNLAVLRVQATGLSALTLARTRVRRGDPTLTVAPGTPGAHVSAAGVVVAPGVPVLEDSPVPYLVTTAAQSVAGAPVVNAAGEVVGLAVAFMDEAGMPAPATAALPAALLEVTLAQVRSATPWRRGVVGLSAHSAVRPSADGATMSEETHLVVSGVAAGLPAERAGLRTGDIIVSVNHEPVDGMDLATLYLALYTLREGQALHLGVERAGQVLEVAPTAVSVRDVLAAH